MDTLTSIRAFRQVIESGSFVAAAEKLDISTAMVSKHVMHTERRLGVRLLNRNSRTLSLTEAGRLYFERCKTLLDDLQAAELELGALSGTPRGTLRITAPSFAAPLQLASLIARFRDRYPDVVIHASFEDRFVDLVDESYDLALRVASSLDVLPRYFGARPIRTTTFCLAASRQYLARHGTPNSPEELTDHGYVAAGKQNSLRVSGENEDREIPLRVVFRYHSMQAAANAIAAGIGIGTVPEFLLEDPTFSGALTPILPKCPLQSATLHIVYVSRNFVPAKVRAFVDFIVESLSSHESTLRYGHRMFSRETPEKLSSRMTAVLPHPAAAI